MYDKIVKKLRLKIDRGDPIEVDLLIEAADAIEAQDRHILTLQHEMMAEAESHIAEVERLNKQIEELFGETERLQKVVMQLENDLGIYDELPIVNQVEVSKTEKTTQWIPVTERLPEKEDEAVIVWEKRGFALIDWRHDNKWVILDNNYGIATHWMPLPEPPKEDE